MWKTVRVKGVQIRSVCEILLSEFSIFKDAERRFKGKRIIIIIISGNTVNFILIDKIKK